MKLQRIEYSDLKSRQKENDNYHKIASILADYGYNSMWLNDDWEGATKTCRFQNLHSI